MLMSGIVISMHVLRCLAAGGEHKLAAIWKYDKRSVNNANFVYFGVCLEAADTPEAKVSIMGLF